jgi:hypothetical protein
MHLTHWGEEVKFVITCKICGKGFGYIVLKLRVARKGCLKDKY